MSHPQIPWTPTGWGLKPPWAPLPVPDHPFYEGTVPDVEPVSFAAREEGRDGRATARPGEDLWGEAAGAPHPSPPLLLATKMGFSGRAGMWPQDPASPFSYSIPERGGDHFHLPLWHSRV